MPKYMNPYLAGTLLGVLLFAAFAFTQGGLGASGGISRLQIAATDLVAPSHVDRVGYFAAIGGGDRNSLDHPSVMMLFGTLAGGLLSGLFHRRVSVEIRRGPRITNAQRLVAALAGGVLMGYGARLARGCTSGQALTGGAVLAVGSWAFVACVFAAGYALAWFTPRLWI